MTSFDSMNGPSVMTRCPFSRRTVLTVFGPWSCSPPTILPLWVYSWNQPPAAAIAALYSSGVRLSQRSWSSLVPTKSSTNFMGNLLNTCDERGARKSTGLARRILGVVDGRPDLDRPRPLFGHGNRLVEVGHVDDGEAADDLFRLDERAVRDADLAVLP